MPFVLRKWSAPRGEFVFYRTDRSGAVSFGPMEMADTFEDFGHAMRTAKAHTTWLDVVPKKT